MTKKRKKRRKSPRSYKKVTYFKQPSWLGLLISLGIWMLIEFSYDEQLIALHTHEDAIDISPLYFSNWLLLITIGLMLLIVSSTNIRITAGLVGTLCIYLFVIFNLYTEIDDKGIKEHYLIHSTFYSWSQVDQATLEAFDRKNVFLQYHFVFQIEHETVNHGKYYYNDLDVQRALKIKELIQQKHISWEAPLLTREIENKLQNHGPDNTNYRLFHQLFDLNIYRN